MKFSVSTLDLQRVLAKIGGVIPAKSTMPILENFLFELNEHALMITATDLMISSTITLNVQGIENGKIAIPAKRLVDTVRSLPTTDAAFSIDAASNKITIATKTGTYSLTGESAAEYPILPAFKETGKFTIDAAVLRKMIHRTAFAVSSDELRPAMMGILLQVREHGIRAVATDGHRLSRVLTKEVHGAKLGRDIIVPGKTMLLMVKAVESGSCEVSVSDSHVMFSFDHTVMVSRLIDETYPNYESVIPTDNTKIMTIGREALIESIRRVALYASATTHQVRFDISPDGLRVSAQDIDFGSEARETIAATYTAEPLEIGFNATYLTDILTHMDGEQVEMRFSSSTRAGIVAPAQPSEQEDVIMLIMPVRLNA
jgi:DNA polymerase-3 subunit beta